MTGIVNNDNAQYGRKYDPESLLTGREAQAGLTYADKRVYSTQATKQLAEAGLLTPEEIEEFAPRRKAPVTAPDPTYDPVLVRAFHAAHGVKTQ